MGHGVCVSGIPVRGDVGVGLVTLFTERYFLQRLKFLNKKLQQVLIWKKHSRDQGL